MTLTTRTLMRSAAAIAATGALVAGLLGGLDFAAGFVGAAALVLVNLALWKGVVRRLIDAALGRPGAWVAVLLVAAKYASLVGGMYLLVRAFPAAAVLLGSSVVVAAVLGFAILGLVSDLQVREGC